MSICGECQQRIGVCSWSREFKPVPGWTATPTKILMYTAGKGWHKPAYVDSYDVTACPLYIPPKKGRGRPTTYRKAAAIIAEDAVTRIKTRYSSIREACKAGGFVANGILDVLEGHKKTHHGHLFYYEGEST